MIILVAAWTEFPLEKGIVALHDLTDRLVAFDGADHVAKSIGWP